MKKSVVISGLPGKMATKVMIALKDQPDFEMAVDAFTGPEIEQEYAGTLRLIRPGQRKGLIKRLKKVYGDGFLVVDFTHPSAVIDNAEFYCRHGLPFVMGTTTTGGDRKRLGEIVEASSIPAVIAPNMAAPVVALQAAMEYMAQNFPNAFTGFEMQVKESHQQGKADTSGTAKAMVAYFNQLGIPFGVNEIKMVREPAEQLAMGIPPKHLDGHGWHTYKLNLPDETMHFEIVHNINGREPYAMGTMKALAFLAKQVQAGVKGKVFSMIDVLRAG